MLTLDSAHHQLYAIRRAVVVAQCVHTTTYERVSAIVSVDIYSRYSLYGRSEYLHPTVPTCS